LPEVRESETGEASVAGELSLLHKTVFLLRWEEVSNRENLTLDGYKALKKRLWGQ